MKFEQFEKILNEYRRGYSMISELYDIGIDLLEGKYKVDESFYNLFMSSLESHYSEQGVDWVTWFIFESDWGEKNWEDTPVYRKNENGVLELVNDPNHHGASDENGNPICYDIKSLWEYIEENHKL